jgi:hypothetical protein
MVIDRSVTPARVYTAETTEAIRRVSSGSGSMEHGFRRFGDLK